MRFANEMKDFLSAYRTVSDTIENSRYKRLMHEYYTLQMAKAKRDQSIQQSFLERAGSNNSALGRPASGGQATPSGTPSSYIDALGGHESSNDPNKRATTSSATGLFQFTDGTWSDLRKAHPELNLTPDGRTDPVQSRRAVEQFTTNNANVLASQTIPATGPNLYMTHFLGPGGGPTFLKAVQSSPTAPATSVVSEDAAEANPTIFFKPDGTARTVQEVYDLQTRRFQNTTFGNDVAPVQASRPSRAIETTNLQAPTAPLPMDRPASANAPDAAIPAPTASQVEPPASTDKLEGDMGLGWEDTGVSMFAETGGMVAPFEEDTDLRTAQSRAFFEPPKVPSAPPSALPVTQAGNQESAPAPVDMGMLGQMLNGAMSHIQKTFGFQPATAVGNPNAEPARRLNSGEGAPSPREFEILSNRVDPDGLLAPGQRMIAMLAASHQIAMLDGDLDKANRFAAGIVQYSQMLSSHLGQVAVGAGRNNNYPAMVRATEAAYNAVPNGQSVSVNNIAQDGAVNATVTNPDGSRQPVRFTPDQIFASALGLAQGGAYWNLIQQAAKARDTTETGGMSAEAFANHMNGGNPPPTAPSTQQATTPAPTSPTAPPANPEQTPPVSGVSIAGTVAPTQMPSVDTITQQAQVGNALSALPAQPAQVTPQVTAEGDGAVLPDGAQPAQGTLTGVPVPAQTQSANPRPPRPTYISVLPDMSPQQRQLVQARNKQLMDAHKDELRAWEQEERSRRESVAADRRSREASDRQAAIADRQDRNATSREAARTAAEDRRAARSQDALTTAPQSQRMETAKQVEDALISHAAESDWIDPTTGEKFPARKEGETTNPVRDRLAILNRQPNETEEQAKSRQRRESRENYGRYTSVAEFLASTNQVATPAQAVEVTRKLMSSTTSGAPLFDVKGKDAAGNNIVQPVIIRVNTETNRPERVASGAPIRVPDGQLQVIVEGQRAMFPVLQAAQKKAEERAVSQASRFWGDIGSGLGGMFISGKPDFDPTTGANAGSVPPGLENMARPGKPTLDSTTGRDTNRPFRALPITP